jgi:sterol desaturase/sphingolipid hydroxylase (fatty acid hydroxylase superfamily)
MVESVVKCFGLGFAWLAARDFFYYWLHRLQHASKWLWAEHALHHSEESLNVTTSIRHHYLEFPLTVLFVNIPLLYLVKPPILSIAAVISILSITEISNHLNLKFGLGPLGWLIATPQNHPHPPLATARAYGQKLRGVFPGLGCAVWKLLPAEKR